MSESHDAKDILARGIGIAGFLMSLFLTVWTVGMDIADRREKAVPLYIGELTAPLDTLTLKQWKSEVVVVSGKMYFHRNGTPTFFRLDVSETSTHSLAEILTHYEELIDQALPDKLTPEQYDHPLRQIDNRRDISIPVVCRTDFAHRSDPEKGSSLYTLRAEVCWKSPADATEITITPKGFGLSRYLYGDERNTDSAVLVGCLWKNSLREFLDSLDL